jgi:hypothetical protein
VYSHSTQYTQSAILLPESFTVGQSLDYIRDHDNMRTENEGGPFEVLYIKNKDNALGEPPPLSSTLPQLLIADTWDLPPGHPGFSS